MIINTTVVANVVKSNWLTVLAAITGIFTWISPLLPALVAANPITAVLTGLGALIGAFYAKSPTSPTPKV